MKRTPVNRIICLTSMIGQGVFVPINENAKLRLHRLISLTGHIRPQDDRYERSLIPFLKKLAKKNGYQLITTDRALRHLDPKEA